MWDIPRLPIKFKNILPVVEGLIYWRALYVELNV